MRIPKFLSPSSKSRWLENRTGFYLKYLADTKMPREPQAIYMGVGSGFDARVKSEIMVRCMGKPLIAGSAYDFEPLFEKQVEHHHRDRALKISTVVWESYVSSGAFEALMDDIQGSPSAPMMEERVQSEVAGVQLLGLPDLVYIDADSGLKIVTDWKILGSASKLGGGASPPQGYALCRDGWEAPKPSSTHGKPHKKHTDFNLKGGTIGKSYLEDFSPDWADQMATYAWLLGSKVGAEDFVVRVESAACRTSVTNGFRVKWSTHMNRVSNVHQLRLIKQYKEIWEAIHSGHIFSEMSKEHSAARCGVLELQAKQPKNLHKPLQNCGADTGNFWMRQG